MAATDAVPVPQNLTLASFSAYARKVRGLPPAATLAEQVQRDNGVDELLMRLHRLGFLKEKQEPLLPPPAALPNPPLAVDIDFDDASRAWLGNKVRRGAGYVYKSPRRPRDEPRARGPRPRIISAAATRGAVVRDTIVRDTIVRDAAAAAVDTDASADSGNTSASDALDCSTAAPPPRKRRAASASPSPPSAAPPALVALESAAAAAAGRVANTTQPRSLHPVLLPPPAVQLKLMQGPPPWLPPLGPLDAGLAVVAAALHLVAQGCADVFTSEAPWARLAQAALSAGDPRSLDARICRDALHAAGHAADTARLPLTALLFSRNGGVADATASKPTFLAEVLRSVLPLEQCVELMALLKRASEAAAAPLGATEHVRCAHFRGILLRRLAGALSQASALAAGTGGGPPPPLPRLVLRASALVAGSSVPPPRGEMREAALVCAS